MTHEPPASVDLLCCPFCGSHPNPDPQNDDCPLPGDYGKDGGRYYQTIWCEKCGAEGGKRETGEEAIAAWNTRASTPPARPGREEIARVIVHAALGNVDADEREDWMQHALPHADKILALFDGAVA